MALGTKKRSGDRWKQAHGTGVGEYASLQCHAAALCGSRISARISANKWSAGSTREQAQVGCLPDQYLLLQS